MECTINWLARDGMAFVAETGSGHLLTMDGAPDGGREAHRARGDAVQRLPDSACEQLAALFASLRGDDPA